jgi:hypothetical protein
LKKDWQGSGPQSSSQKSFFEPKTIEDLYKLYPQFHSQIPKIYEHNGKDIEKTNFELKEMYFEPPPLAQPQKKQAEAEEDMEELKLASTQSSNSQPELKTSLSNQLSDDTNEEKRLITEFTYDHKGEVISKQDLDFLIETIREGQKSSNVGEENYLQQQYTRDLFLLQRFIEKKYEEVKVRESINGTLNIHNREEFPSLSEMDHQKNKNPKPQKKSKKKTGSEIVQTNIIEDLKAQKKLIEEQKSNKGLVNVRVEDESTGTLVLQTETGPLSQWNSFGTDSFVLGNVHSCLSVRTTGELLQTA